MAVIKEMQVVWNEEMLAKNIPDTIVIIVLIVEIHFVKLTFLIYLVMSTI